MPRVPLAQELHLSHENLVLLVHQLVVSEHYLVVVVIVQRRKCAILLADYRRRSDLRYQKKVELLTNLLLVYISTPSLSENSGSKLFSCVSDWVYSLLLEFEWLTQEQTICLIDYSELGWPF